MYSRYVFARPLKTKLASETKIAMESMFLENSQSPDKLHWWEKWDITLSIYLSDRMSVYCTSEKEPTNGRTENHVFPHFWSYARVFIWHCRSIGPFLLLPPAHPHATDAGAHAALILSDPIQTYIFYQKLVITELNTPRSRPHRLRLNGK